LGAAIDGNAGIEVTKAQNENHYFRCWHKNFRYSRAAQIRNDVRLSKLYPWLRKLFLRALRLCAIIYVILCIGCAGFQRRLIYFPPSIAPEEVEKYATSQKLERWMSPTGEPIGWKRLCPTQPAQGQVLITHGNAGCAFQCGHYADVIQEAAPLDVFIVEYPGYENRPGKPSEVSLDRAADEAFVLLSTNQPIYVVGESLGTGVATFLAGKHSNDVAGVVLLAPYNKLAAVGQAHMVILPVALLLRDRFPSEDYLRTYHGPVAMLVGGRDNVIPEKFGRRLYQAYSGPKRLWEFPEGNHGTVMMQPPEVWRQIIEFWESNRRPL
jgi:pimeloyl-ACP methyl ester carboxylesterase